MADLESQFTEAATSEDEGQAVHSRRARDEDKEEPLFAKQSISFLDLPAEIRVKIYKLTIANCRLSEFIAPLSRDHLPLFAANRQVYEETRAVLFRKTHISVYLMSDSFLVYEDGRWDKNSGTADGGLTHGLLERARRVNFMIDDRTTSYCLYNHIMLRFYDNAVSLSGNNRMNSYFRPDINIYRNPSYSDSIKHRLSMNRWNHIKSFFGDEVISPDLYDPYFEDMKADIEAEFEAWIEAEGPGLRFSSALYRALMRHIEHYQTKTYHFQRQQDWWPSSGV